MSATIAFSLRHGLRTGGGAASRSPYAEAVRNDQAAAEEVMGLFRRRRSASPVPASTQVEEVAVEVVSADDEFDVEVVGESHYQENLRRVVADGNHQIAVLMPEPSNLYDQNAIEVIIQGLRVGYVARAQAAQLQPVLIARETLVGIPCTISGDSFLGVFLRRSLIGDEPGWRPRT